MSKALNAGRGLTAAGCILLLIVIAVASVCGAKPPSQTDAQCGSADLTNAIRELGSNVDFEVLAPTYLPSTTSSKLEATVHAPAEASGDVVLLFPICSKLSPLVLGPQVYITESTRPVSFRNPDSSFPPTQQLEILGTSVLKDEATRQKDVSIGLSWQQGQLYLTAVSTWQSVGGGPPDITDEMTSEAVRVVESMIKQGHLTAK
jgi:hypothetical protein